jgi:Family of unknown function (DUF6152)
MKRTLSFALAAGFGFLTVCTVFAHHSNAVFDHEHMTILTGTVIRHEFINPHDLLHLSVTDENGKVSEWIVTGGPPSEMRRFGWTANMFKVGEELTVYGEAYTGWQAYHDSDANRATQRRGSFDQGRRRLRLLSGLYGQVRQG